MSHHHKPGYFLEKVIAESAEVRPLLDRIKSYLSETDLKEVMEAEKSAAMGCDALWEEICLFCWRKGDSVLERFYGVKSGKGEGKMFFDLRLMLNHIMENGLEKGTLLIPKKVVRLFLDVMLEKIRMGKKVGKVGIKTDNGEGNENDILNMFIGEQAEKEEIIKQVAERLRK